MKIIFEIADACSSSADRFGTDDVIRLSIAKGLMEDSFEDGINTAILFLKGLDPSCHCANTLQNYKNDLLLAVGKS